MEPPNTARFHDTMNTRSLQILGTPVLRDAVDDSGAPTKKERQEFVPAWKQTVTDEQGRRRFHGAFTGGFSAGYFNTVGSKEGFTPAAFVSSRDARAAAAQSVDDFMDDEDRQAGLATTLSAKQGFGTFADPGAAGATAAAAAQSVEGAMATMLQRAPDTMGLTLMRKLGWTDGQGVGPLRRVRVVHVEEAEDLQEKKRGASQRPVAGPALSRAEIDELRAAPIAPRDVGVRRYTHKDDPRGLGYRNETLQPLPTARKRVSKDAFGLGALEEPDGDVDNPFDVDDMSQYDAVEGRVSAASAQYRVPAASASAERCSDGRAPLRGFVVARNKSLLNPSTRSFPPVAVPLGWRPSGAPTLAADVSGAQPSVAVMQWAVAAAQRGLALLAAKREREAVKQEPPVPVLAPSPGPPPPPPQRSAATPFAGDPAKQRRYQNWLLTQNGFTGVHQGISAPSPDELVEFVRARTEWVAVPQGMADRFAPAGAAAASPVVADAAVPEDASESFRKFGVGTTRSEQDWAPEPLLCKRFGIQDPFADSSRPRPGSAKAASTEAFPSLTRELERQFGHAYHVQMSMVAAEAEAEAARRREAGVAAAAAHEQQEGGSCPPFLRAHLLTLFSKEVRPARDVFNAIFDTPILVVDSIPSSSPAPASLQHPLPVPPPPAPAPPLRPLPGLVDAGQPSFFRSLFGDTPSAAAAAVAEPAPKRSKAMEMLEKTVVLSDWVKEESRKHKKLHKKEKKKKSKKKDDKKKKHKH